LGQQRIVSIVRIWFRFLIAGTLIGAILSLGFSFLARPSYASHVTLLVTTLPSASGINFSDVEMTQALAPTFADLATTTPVLQRVIAATGLPTDPDRLALAVTTRVPAGTGLLEVTVLNADAKVSARLANAIAGELEDYPTNGLHDQPSALKVALVVVDPATVPTSSQGPGTPLRIGLGAAIALFLSVGFVLFVEILRAERQAAPRNRLVPDVPEAPPPSARTSARGPART
jgi:capsular polysaccharide biosynthesis protein